MDTVIVALDGGNWSERALPAAKQLAARFGARLLVVHVSRLQPGLRGSRFAIRADEDERREHLESLVAGLREDGVAADLELTASSLGHPAAVIAEAARRHRAGAIVVATRGHSPMVGVLASSVAQRLMHDAPCPVLVVTPRTTRETFRSVNGGVVGKAA